MRERKCMSLLLGLLAFTFSGISSTSWAQGEVLEFDELRVLIEINATDGDAGFQTLLDADEWKEVDIRDTQGLSIYSVKGYGSVREQGLTENFFESAEPSCAETPLGEFLDRFPAGTYQFSGKTLDNDKLEGEAILTHVLPGAPENLSPTGGGVSVASPVAISWTGGSSLGACPPNGAEIVIPSTADLFGFKVIVEREVPEPLVIFTVDLPASATSVTIPAEFLEEDAIYKYEIIAIEEKDDDGEPVRGNQTISEDFFCTFVPTMATLCELPD